MNTQTLTGGHTYGVISMLRLSDNKFASASIDKSIKIWQIGNGSWQCIQTLQGQSHAIYSLSRITSNTEEKFASGSYDNTIYLWRLNYSNKYENYQILNEHSNGVFAIILHPDQTLISDSYDKSIKVWA